MRRITAFAAVLAVLLAAPAVRAKLPPRILKAVLEAYPPAVDSKALHSAYTAPDPKKMRGYVVMERGGIPAERARFFISWSDYDYRGVVIHLGGEDRMSTHRGSPYTYLKRGDVMAVTGVKDFRDTIYLKLMSADVYVPDNRAKEKRHSRVTVMLGFKFPKDVIKGDDAGEVMRVMGEWVKPFRSLDEARTYAQGMEDADKAGDAGDVAAEDARIQSLEEKIEAAKRNIEEAEKELGEMKKDNP